MIMLKDGPERGMIVRQVVRRLETTELSRSCQSEPRFDESLNEQPPELGLPPPNWTAITTRPSSLKVAIGTSDSLTLEM
jgi:hypothetical protein